MSCAAVPPILADDSKRRKNLADDTPLLDCYDKETYCFQDMLPRLRRLISLQYRRWVINFHFSKFLCYENAYDCHPMNKPFVSAVLFGFHGINLFKNLVSRELLRILENFHFSISISKHFDFTFHFSKKSERLLFSLCTSRKRVKAFCFHFSNFKNPLSLVPAASVRGCASEGI